MGKKIERIMKKGLALILAAGMAFSSPTELLAKEVISKEPETVEQEELQIGEQEPSEETQIEKQEPSTEPSHHALGYRPIDIKPERSELAESLESLQSLESSYRSPYVTKVKDQGNYGTCWAHAIAACAESSMLKKGLVTKEEDDDFSERHLSYYICNFKDIEDPLETAKGDYMECKVYDEKGKSLDPTINGGSYFEGSLFLMAYRGLASEMDYPYPDNYSLPSLPSTTEDLYGKNVAELTGVDILDISQTSVVKQAIKDYGAVAVSYYHSDAYESSDESSYYCYLNQAANHGVTLVGWDDDYPASNFKRKPENNGAWLIKNSWGEKYGDNGYCWISYEDKTLCDVYAFDFDSPDKYDNNYIYSGGLFNAYEDMGSSYSNVYEIQGDNEVLEACGIFEYDADVNYSLQIYKNPEKIKDPESGEELLEEPLTGSFLFGGYHTVTLPDPVRLSKGDSIAIVFTLSKEDGSNCNICFDTTYTYSDKLANYNYVTKESKYQSFYKNRMGWHDYYSLGKTARINALTKNVKESISDANISFVNGSVYTYTGSAIEPELKVTIGDTTLIKDTDYTVEYENNTDAGFKNPLLPSSTDYPKAIVKGKGAYASEETRELNFTITPLILTESSEGLTITPDEVDYSPKGNEPDFTLTYKGNTLEKGKDYTVVYKNTETTAKAADENAPTATITGIKNYLGTLIKKTYTINRRELLSENIDYEKEVDFTDKDSKVVKSVTVDGVILTEDSDYKVTYAPLVESGNTASATVEGLSNYSGNVTINYDIRSVDAKSLEVELLDAKGNVTDSFEYTGSEIKPAVNVMLSGTTVDESNYTLSYKNNIDKADKDSKNPPTVTVSGKGIIQGSKEVSFNIVGKIVTDENIKISLDQESFSYDGEEKKPLPTVTFVENDKETLLTEGTDYELSYENNINAANADAKEGPRLILTFMGEYSGTIKKAFTILPRDIGSEDILLSCERTCYYTGSEIKPEFILKDIGVDEGRKILKENEDYTVSYSNNIEVSTGAEEGKTPRADISGIGNYTNLTGFDFEILAAPEGLWVENVEASKYTGDEIYYTGKAETIAGLKVYWNSDLLTLNEDYTIKYANNKNAYDISSSDLEDKKAPSFTITGKGNYKDKLNSKKVLFTINPKAIEDTFSDEVYMTLKAGKLQKGKPKINYYTVNGDLLTLKENTDYTIDYDKAVAVDESGAEISDFKGTVLSDAGRYKIPLKGKGNYTGDSFFYETISKDKVSSSKLNISKALITIDDTAIKKDQSFDYIPDSEIKLSNYKLSYTDPATGVLTALKEYDPKGDVEFKDCHYMVSYKNNTKAGKATLTFTGINLFGGKLTKTFTIDKIDLQSEDISLSGLEDSYLYLKNGVYPDFTLAYNSKDAYSELVLGRDYTVKYSNNKAICEALTGKKVPLITIVGKGNYKGKLTKNFTILNSDISTLSKSAYANDVKYTEKTAKDSLKTSVVIYDKDGKELKMGKDYEKNIGYYYESDTTVKIIKGTFTQTILRAAGSKVESYDLIPSGAVILARVTGKDAYSGQAVKPASLDIPFKYYDADKDISKALVTPSKTGEEKLCYNGGEEISLEASDFDLRLDKYSKALSEDSYEPVYITNRTKPGKTTVIIKGKGSYGGLKKVQLTISTRKF